MPTLPGLFGPGPPATSTTTMRTVLPEIVLPDLVIALETSTPMYPGTTAVGGGLFPPSVLHGGAHEAGGVVVGSVTVPANPLNEGGALPPDSELADDQLLLQNVTLPVSLLSPRT